LVQIPILIGLFIGLQRLIKDSHEIVNFAYPFIQDLGWLKTLASDISQFDYSLFGAIDLHRTALGAQGTYWPAILLAAAASIMQYFQSRMLMPKPEDGRTLRAIMKEAGKGKSADQSEVSAAVGRSTLILIPAMVFLFSLTLAAALPLYWLVGSAVAYWQQKKILGQDANEARAIADEPTVVPAANEQPPRKSKKRNRPSNRRSAKKRKRR
jgi:YidC/Oxa1 family membrane protein insertase